MAAAAFAELFIGGGRQLLQQQQQQHQQLLPAPQHAPQVLGVGLGVFLLAFFLVVCVIVALLGSRTTSPGLVYAASGGTYGVLVLVLVASPKGAAPPPSPVGYDTAIIPLVATIALVAAAAASSLVGLLVFHARAAVYARPLSHFADVLQHQPAR